MTGRAFLDTNVLVYLFDRDSPTKQATARGVVESRMGEGSAVVSTQVLQEFYVVVTRRLGRPMAEADAEKAVRDLTALPTVSVDTAVVLDAIERSRRQRLSFWDALIVQAAIVGGCDVLLSEDLSDGVVLDGVRVENPFAAKKG